MGTVPVLYLSTKDSSRQWSTHMLQSDAEPLRPILIQASDRHIVGRERVVAGDKEPADDMEWCVLAHLGNRQLPRVLALPRDIPVHRILKLPLPPGARRLWTKPLNRRTSVLWAQSTEIWPSSAKQGFFAFLKTIYIFVVIGRSDSDEVCRIITTCRRLWHLPLLFSIYWMASAEELCTSRELAISVTLKYSVNK